MVAPEDLGSTMNNHTPLTEKEYPLHLIGFEVSIWDAQQAGLSKGDTRIGNDSKDNTDTNAKENTVVLDQLQQQRVRRRKLIAMAVSAESLTNNVPVTFNKAQTFPTDRRPMKRPMTTENETVIHQWFKDSGISVGELDRGQRNQVERLLYTWKDIFTDDMLKIKECDLVEHAIDIKPGAKPVKTKTPLYTEEEITFLAKLIPAMEKAGLIARCDSLWVHRTKYPPRKKSDLTKGLRQVHNFIPINKVTVKSFYPSPRIEQITHNRTKNEMQYYSWFDAANAYWSVPLRKGDELKTAFVCPYGQFCYKRMGQGLKNVFATFSRLRDIMCGPLPELPELKGSAETKEEARRRGRPPEGFRAEASITGNNGFVVCDGMVDDTYVGAVSFDVMIEFLHDRFFPRCDFARHYLKPSKMFLFFKTLEFVGLQKGPDGLRPSMLKRETILKYPTPRSQAEVETFLYWTPFLRRFIPGRAELARVMKGDASAESFEWTPEKNKAFVAIKEAIANNAMSGGNP